MLGGDKVIDIVSISECALNFKNTKINKFGFPEYTTNLRNDSVLYLATLARYGRFAGLISKIGVDAFGLLALNALSDYGINCCGIKSTKHEHTSLVFENKNSGGIESYIHGADSTLTKDEVNTEIIKTAKIYHFTSNSLCFDPLRSTVMDYADFAKENGLLISFTPNLNEHVWPDINTAKNQIFKSFDKADYVTLTASEAEILYGVMPEKAANEIIKQHNVKAVFVQETVNRTYFQTSIHCGYYINDFKSDNIISTGVFSACIAYGVLKINKQLDDMTYDDYERIASFATRTASLYNKDEDLPDLQIF